MQIIPEISEADCSETSQRKQTITIVDVATMRFASRSGLDKNTKNSRLTVEVASNKKINLECRVERSKYAGHYEGARM